MKIPSKTEILGLIAVAGFVIEGFGLKSVWGRAEANKSGLYSCSDALAASELEKREWKTRWFDHLKRLHPDAF